MLILLFTGNSGVGKTTIAGQLSEDTAAPLLVEREIFRELAHERGHERGRHLLAAIGLTELLRLARDRTLKHVAKIEPVPLLLLDGAYDLELQHAFLREVPTADIRTVVITAPLDIRLQRVAQRLGETSLTNAQREISFLDELKILAGMPTLISKAWLTLPNTGTVAEACATIRDTLKSRV